MNISILINNRIKRIEAFADSGLTSVIIPDSVVEIGAIAFGGCSDLKSVTISNPVTEIKKNAFEYCKNLTPFSSVIASPMTLAAIYNQHETDFEITAKRKNLGFHIDRVTHLHEKSMNETSKNVVISCLQTKLDFKFRIRII